MNFDHRIVDMEGKNAVFFETLGNLLQRYNSSFRDNLESVYFNEGSVASDQDSFQALLKGLELCDNLNYIHFTVDVDQAEDEEEIFEKLKPIYSLIDALKTISISKNIHLEIWGVYGETRLNLNLVQLASSDGVKIDIGKEKEVDKGCSRIDVYYYQEYKYTLEVNSATANN